ncbi:MAG: helicase HerA-like domain-containing protein, partial [Lachnospiraceae bacterium]
MVKDGKIWMSQNETPQFLYPKMANRHGLIAGATGTGKTITLKVMAEAFSSLGVPVFLADIKGDLSGMCQPGKESESMSKRIAKFGIEDWTYTSFPTRFFDIFGKNGHPVRTTVSDMGPILLSRLLGLTAVQEGVLNIVFRVADDNGLLLIDLKDLKAMLQYVSEHREEYTLTYGNVSPQSAGAIQRALLALEDQGGNLFFGEPALDIMDWITTDASGRGMINILDSTELVQSPILYATFLLWLLTELFERLPEVGDADKPKLVFFFDEAHLLFRDMPKALTQKIEQVVKLIRSKGVGVYFISQSPSDIPDEVLAQLGNRIQHALRAYTPAEQKAVRTAAQTFRQNPAFDTSAAIMELGVGEALVSFLDEQGIPTMVERTFILPPQSLMGPVDAFTRNSVITSSPLDEKYGIAVDNHSAYEALTEQTAKEEAEEQKAKEEAEAAKQKAK